MQDNSQFLQQSQNCENAQKNNNLEKISIQNNEKLHCKKLIINTESNDEFNLINNDLLINSSKQNDCEKNINVSNICSSKCAQSDTCKNNTRENFSALKNSYNNVSHKNNISYKNNIKAYSATTKVCLWLFLLVACLAVTIGFGCVGGSSGNGSLKVAPEIETATAAGSSWSGSGTSGSPYLISNEAELTALATACNSGTAYSGTYFKLTQDISITSTNWAPIGFDESSAGTPTNVFSGIFDGAEHTITISNTFSKAFDLTVAGGYAYCGAVFGFVQNGRVLNLNVKFNLGANSMFDHSSATTTKMYYYMYGGIVGGCQSADSENPIIQNCSVLSENNSEIKVNFGFNRYCSFGGIVGRVIGNGIIDNCSLNASLSSMGHSFKEGGIVAYSEGKVTNCSVNSDIICGGTVTSGAYVTDQKRGGIAGVAETIENCAFNGGSFTCDAGEIYGVGVIAGEATTIKNCKVLKGADSTKKIKIETGSGTKNGFPAGVIAGACKYIENCYTNAIIDYVKTWGDSRAYAGVIAGQATTVKNCKADVSIGSYSSNDICYFGHIVGAVTTSTLNGSTVNPSITNCFIQVSTTASQPTNNAQVCSNVSSGTLTTYNCVFIGVTGLKFTSSIAATAGDSYGLYASSSDVAALKKTSTYAGAGANGYTWNSAAPWDFESAWCIETENETYPTLQFMSAPCTVTINVTTSAGAGGVVGTDKYILYKLNSAGTVVNQFVVSHNSVVTFLAKRGEKITLLTTYRSYLYWTVDGTQVDKYQFTPSGDTTIAIHIAAPAVINNSIVI